MKPCSPGPAAPSSSLQTSLAGIVAATALAIIYVGLGWFSNRLPVDPAVLADLKERGQDLGTLPAYHRRLQHLW